MSLTIQDIHAAIQDAKHSGHGLSNIEALLVHSDDFGELLRSIDEHNNGCAGSMVHMPTNLRNAIVLKRINDSSYEITALIDGNTSSLTWPCEGIVVCGMKIVESPYVQKGSIFKVFKDGKQQVRYPGFTATTTMPEHLRLPTVVDGKKKEKHSKTRKIELG